MQFKYKYKEIDLSQFAVVVKATDLETQRQSWKLAG